MQTVRYISDQQKAEERCKQHVMLDGAKLRHTFEHQTLSWCILAKCSSCGMLVIRRLSHTVTSNFPDGSLQHVRKYHPQWEQIALPDGQDVPRDPSVIRRTIAALRAPWGRKKVSQ